MLDNTAGNSLFTKSSKYVQDLQYVLCFTCSQYKAYISRLIKMESSDRRNEAKESSGGSRI